MEEYNTLWQQLAYLEQKLNQQHLMLEQLNEKVDELIDQQRNSHKVADKVEYNFEQLKIETLEGTLNIGLTPQEDLPFKQLDLPKESSEETLTPMEQQVYNQLMPFIRKELPHAIKHFTEENDIELDQKQQLLILQDIKDQLPNRIKEHTSSMQKNGRVIIDKEQIPALIKHIQKEITQGIDLFLNQIKENEEDER
ncbi:spore germination protein GerPC [Piscibacillus sp. B03]|uniref:spore germination protein GerPC n=1 Tax=Piscibacillus sp. B03 TaxID=3457430 RepID=UPI003FCC2DCC